MFHKKKEIPLPTWSDMSIKQFVEISEINPDDENAIYCYLAIINDLTLDEIVEKPVKEVVAMTKQLEFLTKAPKRHAFPKKTYLIGGREYVACLDPDKMTTAQYIDFQMLDDYSHQIAEMLSVILVPKGKKYGEGYEIADVRKEIYERMKIEDALTLANFYLTLFEVSTRLTKVLLRRELRKAEKQAPTKEIREKIHTARKTLRGRR